MKHKTIKKAIVMMLALTMLFTSTGTAVFAESLNEEAANQAAETAVTEQAAEEAAEAEEAKEDADEAKASKLTAKDWEAKLPSKVSDDVREAMAQVAKSQDGADIALFMAFANADSLKAGDASFVMFVLEYANVLGVHKAIKDDSKGTVKAGDIEFPVNADTDKWIKALKKADLYTEVSDENKPEQGDIVFTNGSAAVVLSADEDKYTLVGIKDKEVEKFTENKIDGYVSLKAIAPERFEDEKAEGEVTEEAKTEELTEEEKAAEEAKKAEEEAKAAEEAKKAEAEAAKAEEEARAAEAAKRIKAEKLVDKKIDAELTSAPGLGNKLRSIFASNKGTEITLNGYLPEDAIVKAYPVKVEIPDHTVLAAYDITIYVKDKDGNEVEWQPAKPLNVSIKTKELAEAAEKADADKAFNVFHMENIDSNPRMVESVDLGGGEASFEADHFSIYVVGEEDTSKHVNYRFWWDESDINNSTPSDPAPYRVISLKNGKELLAPADPIDATRGAFEGWYTKVNGEEVEFSCEGETASIADDAAEDINTDIYAKFSGDQYADFQSLYIDMKRTVFHVEKLTNAGDGTYSLDLSKVPTYGAPVGYKFLGWALTQPTDPLGYGENIPKSGDGRYYKPNETITGLTGNVTLYPVVKKMYTVSLDANGGYFEVNGSTLPVYKVQVTNDDVWETAVPSYTSAKRPGYTRNNGYFDGPDDSATAVSLSGDVSLTDDATYYIHWNTGTTTVTVKYWKQAVNTSDPYSLIDEDTFTVNTGTTVELGKQNGSSVSRTDVLFYNPGSTTANPTLNINTVISRVQSGEAKLGNASEGNYAKDADLKYFEVNSISAADPDGVRHSSSPTDDRDFVVAEDGSTVVNVWMNRKTYSISFHFQLSGSGSNIHQGTGRINKNYGPYTIKLGQDVTSIWPDLSDSSLDINFFGLGYTPVAMGKLLQAGGTYPDCVTNSFTVPLSVATSELLDLASGSTIELYGRYNQNNIHGGIRTGTLYEYRQNVDGSYTRSSAIQYKFGRGDNQSELETITSSIYPGYVLNSTQTAKANTNVHQKTDNGDGTYTIQFVRNGNYTANFYYDLDTYTVNLQYGDTVLASGTDIKFTQNIKSYLQSSSATSTVFADPTAAAGVPDYMEFKGWYTDEEFSETYALKDTATMPYTNVSIYAKFSPKPVTVHVDNGIETGTETIADPQLNLSGSEMGGSIRYLDYQHEYGTTTSYAAHAHTIAEFLPNYWVTPVWENHVFTGWQISYDGGATWSNLTDVNIPVDKSIKLKANWQEMTRHNIHYIENNKEVYLDPEAYVEGSTVVIKGTDTEIYHKDTKVTEVFQDWKDSEGNHYKPGQTITMGSEDITLTAVFAEGGASSGSEKATYTFMVPVGEDGWEKYYEETVYRAERLSPPPKTPTHGTDVFEGWYLDSELTKRFNGFDQVVSSPIDTTLYASFQRPYRVTYRGYDASGDGELITVQTYQHDGTENLNTMGVGADYTYKSGSTTYALIGWDTEKRTPGDVHKPYWSGYTDKKITSDMTLYPVLEDGFWLTFHQDENMVTIPAVYYTRSQNLNFTWPDPDEVTRKNYIFTGKWYTDEARTQEFNWNQTLTADTKIYADWEPDETVTSKYTVVWWVEKADSNGNANNTSNYAYSNSTTVDGIKLGTTISNTVQVTSEHMTTATAANNVKHANLVYENGTDYSKYFAVNSYLSDASTTVTDDGSATLNIYVQRVRYTLQFNVRVSNQNRGTITFGGNNYTTNWPETAWFEMPLAGKWPVDTGDGNTVPKLTMGSGYRYGGWDNANFSNPTTVPDIVPHEWLNTVAVGGTITLNLLGNGSSTQTAVHYRFLNDVTKDGNVASNYDATTFDGRSFDQTLNSSGNFGAKDILGYDHHADIGTNPTTASGGNPRTYTFYYTRQAYKIHLHDANGSEIAQGSPITLLVGESLAGKIDDPSAYGISTPAGKEFAGWSRSADSLVNVYDPEDSTATMPLYDIHYYLHWKDKQVTVKLQKSKLNGEGDVVPSGETQDYTMVYGSKLSEFGLANQELENYKFMGWLNAETNEPITLTTAITENITVKGDYRDLRSKALIYNLNGGELESGASDPIEGTTLVSEGVYKDNDQYMVGASVPVKNISAEKLNRFFIFPAGRVDFAYWNTEPDGRGDTYFPNDAIEIPNGTDIVLYAIYSPDLTTTLEYDLNYTGQPEQLKSVTFRDYRSQEYNAGELKVNDSYTVATEYDSGDQSYKTLSYQVGSETKTVDKMRPGYKLLGWSTDSEATTAELKAGANIRVTSYDDENHHLDKQTLYAVWEPIQLPVEVYEITDAYPGTEQEVTGESKPYLVAADIEGITNSAKADSVVAESYDAYTRNSVQNTYAFGKAMLSKADADFENDSAITFIRINSTTNTWQYATAASPAETDWTDFGETYKLRLYYYPNPRDVNVYFVAEEEDGTLTELETSLVKEIKPTLFTISNSATTGDNALKIEDSITKTNKLYNLKHIAIGPEKTDDTVASALTSLDSNEMYLKNKFTGVFYSTATENSDLKDAQALPAAKPALYIVYKEKTTSQLAVMKTATGEYADLTKEFDFTISGLTAGKQYDFAKFEKGTNNAYVAMTGAGATGKLTVDSDGKVTFKLKHDQKIELQMPVNTALTISETQAGGYASKWSVDSGSQSTAESVAVQLTPTADKTVDCENDFDDNSIVPSGISGQGYMLMLVMLAFVLATAEFYILMKRRRYSR